MTVRNTITVRNTLLASCIATAAFAYTPSAHAQFYMVREGSAQIGGGIAPYSYGLFYGVQSLPPYGTGEPTVSRLVYGYTPIYTYGSPYGYWPNYTYPRAFVVTTGPAAPVGLRYVSRTTFVEPLTIYESLYWSHHHRHAQR